VVDPSLCRGDAFLNPTLNLQFDDARHDCDAQFEVELGCSCWPSVGFAVLTIEQLFGLRGAI
jgi:hypothetical protein